MGMVDQYKNAIEQFKTKNLNNIMKGFSSIGKMFGEGLVDLSLCPGVRDSV